MTTEYEAVTNLVDAGFTVYSGTKSYKVIKGTYDYLIKCGFNDYFIGLGTEDNMNRYGDKFFIVDENGKEWDIKELIFD